ncbi:flagellar basal body-associated FliL family protein [Phycicoccus sonneratiae]|uniref:Flagellar protein FliL n=1 Tax=Phycicoccus sonneratiae TaxID=2807628 RepID=A0ABS2CNI8_9MICO|nr:flagellar basal body-associated FliL family protein [Phycicoccus sonneraticus]MBM6401452.1 flagellar basal body-associated FliL family protein [Phycicoccus sonneraticus]
MSTATAAAPAAAAAEPAKKKKPLLLVIVVVLALAGGGGWYFLKGSSGEDKAAEPVVESGPVVDLESMTLNLSDGRYLKIGLSLEVTEEANAAAGSEGVNGAKARDAAITILGQHTYDQMLVPKQRAAAVKALTTEIEKRYDGDVLDVYVTEFVMQ